MQIKLISWLYEQSFGLNWRIAFWIGAAIAMVGAVARTTLRETPEFADAKRRLQKKMEKAYIDHKTLEDAPIFNEKANHKTTLYLLLVNCAWPACFYFAYVHCGNILKNSFSYNAESVIHHNLII